VLQSLDIALYFWYEYSHTEVCMPAAKIAISLEKALLKEVDKLVSEKKFQSRSALLQVAVSEKIARLAHTRLAAECEKLVLADEQAMAEEGWDEDEKTWPAF